MKDWQARIALMRAKMEVAVTVLLLAAALYVILLGGANPNQQWAVGVVGVVRGDCGVATLRSQQVPEQGRAW